MNCLMILSQIETHATADEFVKLDPLGLGMTLIAMLVVIGVLAFIASFFQNLERFIRIGSKILSKRKEKTEEVEVKVKVSTSGEEAAAIALALHLFISDQHDSESLNLTLSRISKTYSPWSSKIYGVMNSLTPRK